MVRILRALWYSNGMTEEQQPRRRGRPPKPGGETPKRNVRIGETWTRGEELARQMTMTMTAYVEEALREKNARTERKLRQLHADLP